MFSLDACLIARVEISLTILLSSKDVACCDTALAETLASGIVPEVKLLAERLVKSIFLAVAIEPEVILLASIFGISLASKVIKLLGTC